MLDRFSEAHDVLDSQIYNSNIHPLLIIQQVVELAATAEAFIFL